MEYFESHLFNKISRVFNWRFAVNNSSINIEGCNTSVLHNINKMGAYIIMLLGDFNTEIGEHHMKPFCDYHSLKSLIRHALQLYWNHTSAYVIGTLKKWHV